LAAGGQVRCKYKGAACGGGESVLE